MSSHVEHRSYDFADPSMSCLSSPALIYIYIYIYNLCDQKAYFLKCYINKESNLRIICRTGLSWVRIRLQPPECTSTTKVQALHQLKYLSCPLCIFTFFLTPYIHPTDSTQGIRRETYTPCSIMTWEWGGGEGQGFTGLRWGELENHLT